MSEGGKEKQVQPQNAADVFESTLNAAAQLPGVRIDREDFLRRSLKNRCDEKTLEAAITKGPVAVGIDKDVLLAVANDSINYETAKVTAISTAAGIPGGLAMAGTIPADTAQYFGHVLRIAQKLAYLYNWPELFSEEGKMDDATEGLLILFIGVMFGVESAGTAIQKVAVVTARAVAQRLPQKALTKGIVYPIVKKVAVYLGYQMTKETFAKGVSKLVPVVGGIISGGLTFATYRPMAARLRDYLAGLPIADPEYYKAGMPSDVEVEAVVEEIFSEADDIIDIEPEIE